MTVKRAIYALDVPDAARTPTLEWQLTWRGAFGRIRVFRDQVCAETSYEQEQLLPVPMETVMGWRIAPCDFDAICVEFIATGTTWRLLLHSTDEVVLDVVLRERLGEPTPSN